MDVCSLWLSCCGTPGNAEDSCIERIHSTQTLGKLISSYQQAYGTLKVYAGLSLPLLEGELTTQTPTSQQLTLPGVVKALGRAYRFGN